MAKDTNFGENTSTNPPQGSPFAQDYRRTDDIRSDDIRSDAVAPQNARRDAYAQYEEYDPYAQFEQRTRTTQEDYERTQREQQAAYERDVYLRRQAYARQQYEQQELARQHAAQQAYEARMSAQYPPQQLRQSPPNPAQRPVQRPIARRPVAQRDSINSGINDTARPQYGRHSAPRPEKPTELLKVLKWVALLAVLLLVVRVGYTATKMWNVTDKSIDIVSVTPPPILDPEADLIITRTPEPEDAAVVAIDDPDVQTTDDPGAYDTTDDDDVEVLDKVVPIYQKAALNRSRVSVLLLGDDAKPGAKRGRTDTMMLLSFDRASGNVDLISFLRDTLVPIEGHDYNRINAAYSYGGAGMMINTLNTYYELDIQNYVICRFETLVSIVDKLGGLPVNLTAAEAKYISTRKQMAPTGFGEVTLNGRQTLAYARIRKIDSDVQRSKRQQKIIKDLYNKLISLRNPNILLTLLETVADSITTNLSQTELLALGLEVLQTKDLQINSHAIPYGRTFSFASYKGMNIIKANREENVAYLQSVLGAGK